MTLLAAVSFPTDWRIVRLGHTFRRRRVVGRPDLQPLSVFLDEGVVPRSSREDNFNQLGSDISKYLVVQPGDLVFNKLRTWQGGLGVSRYQGIVSPAYYVCKPDESIHSEFVHFLLRSHPYLCELTRVSKWMPPSQFDIAWGDLKSVPLTLPPLPEQRAIATFLDRKTAAIDDLIRAKERLIALLQKKRQALITQAVTKGLDPNVPMKDSGIEWLGEVPAHWEVLACKRLIQLATSGSRGWASYYSSNGALFLQSGNLDRRLGLDLRHSQRVNLPESAEGLRTRVRQGDVLVCITGALTGNVSVVEQELEEAYVNQHLALVRSRPGEADPYFLAAALSSQPGQIQFSMNQYGGTKQGLGLEDVRNASIAVPPLAEQVAISSAIRRAIAHIDGSVRVIQKSIVGLVEYRQSLISAAVTGQLDITAESPLPDAVPG